jgi:His/Glu/Gln/Arg/opine family amino acid ABC transporter permease subunit
MEAAYHAAASIPFSMEAIMQAGTMLERSELSRQILAQQDRARRDFQIKVLISWGVLAAFVFFLFSGVQIQIGGFTLRTIHLDTHFIARAAPTIASGVPITLALSAVAIAGASVLALLSALASISRIAPLYALSTFYVSLIRGTPLLVQIFFFFLALPQIGIVLPGFTAGVLALALNYGAYMS